MDQSKKKQISGLPFDTFRNIIESECNKNELFIVSLMKYLIDIHQGAEMPETRGFEVLNVFEMYRIRGGGDNDKIDTKEIDIYDVREN